MIEMQLALDRGGAKTLVEQLVDAFREAIECRTLRAGVLLPSVRELARLQRLSTFTVLEAYSRLVALELIVARRGAGYRVAPQQVASNDEAGPLPERSLVKARAASSAGRRGAVPPWQPPSLNATWLLSDVFADHSVPIKAGCGWLPGEWVNETGLHHALRAIGRVPAARLGDYGHPYGFAPLRERIAAQMDRRGLPLNVSDHILLTQGATQALDLVVRTLLRPGDTVIVEDPGYCNLLQILALAGLRVVGVPRTPTGIDTDVLAQVAATHRPAALFVNTTLQNPTGSTLSMAAAFRVLQLAEQHGMWVIEDDVSRELAPAGAPLLAAMEGLRQVIHVGGFAKTITPSLRCGFVLAERDVLRALARTKMAVGLTSSDVSERIVEKVIAEGRYARHIDFAVRRLQLLHTQVEERMDSIGVPIFHRPRAGLFLWAQLPVAPDAAAQAATKALSDGIWLAPGSYFRPNDEPTSWFRFNVPYSLDDALWRSLERLRG